MKGAAPNTIEAEYSFLVSMSLIPDNSNAESVGQGEGLGFIDDNGFVFFDNDAFGAIFL